MTYKYKCQDCGHIWETEQKITDDPIKVCEKCGEEKAQRQLYAAVFHLGSGAWAKTGYK